MSRKSHTIILILIVWLTVIVTAFAMAQDMAVMVHTTSFDGIGFTFADAYARHVNITHYAGDPPEGGAPGFTDAPYTEFVLYQDAMAPYSLFDTGGLRVYHLSDLASYDFMQANVEQLQMMIEQQPDLAPHMQGSQQGMALPFLPTITHGQVIRARAHYIETDYVRGIAYLFASQAAAEPFMDTSFIYTFQGISTDDQFYVSFVVPVRSSGFPADGEVAIDMAAFQESLPGYYVDSIATLNAASADAFSPDLSLLDEVVVSITFEGISEPQITITPTFTPTPSPLTPPAQACQIPSGWVTYVVVRGDTLASIARRADTTVATLVQANCIPNANQIMVGQQLYVPTTVPTMTPTATLPSNGQEIGLVNILPFVNGPSGVAELDRGATVTFTWNEAPLDAAFVQFILLNPASEGSQVLATDTNPADGASASWVVPDQLDGLIKAIAYRSDQSQYVSSLSRPVVSRPPIAQIPAITTFRVIAAGSAQAIEWQTENVGMVNIVWSGSDGAPGGSVIHQPANGSIPMPELGPEFAPFVYFYLFALDANGQEIRDPYSPANVLDAELSVNVSSGVVFTGGPNPAPSGGTVTLTWDTPGTQSMAISRSRPAEQGYDLVQDGLPSSGDLVVTIPAEFSNFIEFVLHPSGTEPFVNGIASYHVSIIAANGSD